MLQRDAAMSLLAESKCEPHLVQHALASEAIMRALAAKLGHDTELWGLTGLLHDLDYPQTHTDPARHGLASAEQLAGQLPDAALDAIKAHNGPCNGTTPSTPLDFALRCAETVTGLVITAALVRPTGLDGMEAKSLKKKMKDKAFAASVNRDCIRECDRLGLDLDTFLTLAIGALTPHARELGILKSA